jgi:hypothetical protein
LFFKEKKKREEKGKKILKLQSRRIQFCKTEKTRKGPKSVFDLISLSVRGGKSQLLFFGGEG